MGRIASALCSFVYIALAVRVLGLTQYGLLILTHSLAMMASTLSRTQSWQTMIQYGNDPYAKKDMVLFTKVLCFCIRLDMMSAFCAFWLGIVIVTLYSYSAGWSDHARHLGYAYAVIGPLMYTGWSSGVLRLTNRFHLVPISDSCTALTRTFGAAIAYIYGFKLPFFVAMWGAAILLDHGLILYFALTTLKKELNLQVTLRDVFGQRKWALPGMWAFTRSVSIDHTLGAVSAPLSVLCVGSLIGTTEAAIFRICSQIAEAIVTPAQMLAPALYPELVRMQENDELASLKRLTWQLFFLLVVIALFLLLIAAVCGGHIFAWLLHIKVPGASFYISVMLVSAVLRLLVLPLEPLLTVMGQATYLMKQPKRVSSERPRHAWPH